MSFMFCCAVCREPTPPLVVDTAHDYETVVRQPAVSSVSGRGRMNAISNRMDTISDRIDIVNCRMNSMSIRLDEKIAKIEGMLRTSTEKLTEEGVEVLEVAGEIDEEQRVLHEQATASQERAEREKSDSN